MLLLLDTSYFRYPCMVDTERGRKDGRAGGKEGRGAPCVRVREGRDTTSVYVCVHVRGAAHPRASKIAANAALVRCRAKSGRPHHPGSLTLRHVVVPYEGGKQQTVCIAPINDLGRA